ncbi:hypothetical protein [Burkholderia pseudomultivorans]|uniref:Uncharacterized protein n=1 Tax=Burkholderia pseudomultivorans TaxID=1207504 RepID=A0A132EM38_9BURK|nr:hypothetical protein [Burkholderia pseudomultivorans]KWF37409.1 hypothetical protein WT56_34280 [Burkholderia pseudomultivorans]
MNFMEVSAYLNLRFGAANPFWTVTDDSNVIRLGSVPHAVDLSSELDTHQLGRIKSLGDEVDRVHCSVRFSGEHVPVYLVGKKVADRKWRGVVSAYPNFVPTDAMIDALAEQGASNVINFPRRKVV